MVFLASPPSLQAQELLQPNPIKPDHHLALHHDRRCCPALVDLDQLP
jgi:hypothetical protein